MDGCSQNFHTDAPHGPYAFVLSLTPDGSHGFADGPAPGWFEGGETTLLRPVAVGLELTPPQALTRLPLTA